MKQRDEIKIGKLLAKFKCTEKEKVFKVKQHWLEKAEQIFKIYALIHPWN